MIFFPTLFGRRVSPTNSGTTITNDDHGDANDDVDDDDDDDDESSGFQANKKITAVA